MHWGVRRYQNKDGSLTPLGKKHVEQNSDGGDGDNYSRPLTKRQIKRMNKAKREEYKEASDDRRLLTDEELSSRINRLRQERELKRLTNEAERPIRTMVSEVVGYAAKETLKDVSKKALQYGVKSVMSHEKMTFKDAAKFIFNVKNQNQNQNQNRNNEDDNN